VLGQRLTLLSDLSDGGVSTRKIIGIHMKIIAKSYNNHVKTLKIISKS